MTAELVHNMEPLLYSQRKRLTCFENMIYLEFCKKKIFLKTLMFNQKTKGKPETLSADYMQK